MARSKSKKQKAKCPAESSAGSPQIRKGVRWTCSPTYSKTSISKNENTYYLLFTLFPTLNFPRFTNLDEARLSGSWSAATWRNRASRYAHTTAIQQQASKKQATYPPSYRSTLLCHTTRKFFFIHLIFVVFK